MVQKSLVHRLDCYSSKRKDQELFTVSTIVLELNYLA